MNKHLFSIGIAAMVLVGLAGLIWLIRMEPAVPLELRMADEAAQEAAMEAKAAGSAVSSLEGEFQRFQGQPSAIRATWPRFRGASYDNIVQDTTPLRRDWGESGPPVVWEMDLGEGHGGAAVAHGCVYLLDYDEEQQRDVLRCLTFDSGEPIWSRGYQVKVKRNHGMSRTVPTVTAEVVVTMGPKCHVLCVDAHSGDFLWGMNLEQDFGTQIPMWYTAQCPVVDDGVVVLAPCGDALMMGVDATTGEILWRTPNPHAWNMSHASIIPMTLHGKRMYVYPAIGGTVGVSAEVADRGTLLWETTAWTHSVVSPSPVQIDDERIFFTAGYSAGSMMLKVNREGETYSTEKLFALEATTFSCEQHTPILAQDHLYTILTKDAEAVREEFACMTLDGDIVWTSGPEYRFGFGPFIMQGNLMLLLDDHGTLTLAETTPRAFLPLASAKVLDGRDAWAPMALVQGRLLLRDSRHMKCLDLRAPAGNP